MKSYIEAKKKVLRDFCIPESVIDLLPWTNCKNEYQVDRMAHDCIAKYL